MKVVFAVILAIIVAIVIGCGGGGGTPSSTTSSASASASATGGTTAGAPVIRLIAQTDAGTLVDPTNLQAGDSVTFELVKMDITTGAITVIPNGGFTTTDTTSAAGDLNRSSGRFSALRSTSGTNYTISTSFNGSLYQLSYGVTVVQARVTGVVVDTNGTAVPYAKIIFYQTGTVQVGSVTANFDGSFLASVPTTAVRFNLTPESLPLAKYYRVFLYQTGTYNPLVQRCSAPLPALSNGTTAALSTSILVEAFASTTGAPNTPPPPPTCGP